MWHDIASHHVGRGAVSGTLHENRKDVVHSHLVSQGSQVTVLATMPKVVVAKEFVAHDQQRPVGSVDGCAG